MEDLSEYEKLRIRNIERNKRFLEELGLPIHVTETLTSTSRKKSRKDSDAVIEPTRKSPRLAKQINYVEVSYILL